MDRAFIARLIELRTERGLSQAKLAKLIGKSESWVSQVERGVMPVERIVTLKALAVALGVSPLDLRPDLGELRLFP